ncbi:zinc finger protein ZAT3-like [Andrographis paniculata]|uniref:zinc finger protein ZAT3-like n=1 Tax=Andrographis paniculata TaxID=175694 RepID=UPI0021E6F015|nr:zinc finger protein ZAT3-like [Andrographis paniculata]
MGGYKKGQKYICKICSKSCASGKSLGGHMRVHLALISSSKSASKHNHHHQPKIANDNQNSCCKLEESSKNQSNTAADESLIVEQNNNNNSYELRENPKRSSRLPDSSVNPLSCKQCGKEFSSLKAVSGHMRSHSHNPPVVGNSHLPGSHKCAKCDKVFGSVRAMFGHMKCHSKKSSSSLSTIISTAADHDLPEFNNLCHIRRKRSRIKYKTSPNPWQDDEEDVAESLIMLSKGVMSFGSNPDSNENKNSAAAGSDVCCVDDYRSCDCSE